MSRTSFSEEKVQLSLDIRGPREISSALHVPNDSALNSLGEPFPPDISNSKTVRTDRGAKLLELSAVVTASILLFIIMLPADKEPRRIAENFIGSRLEPAHPIRRKLPNVQPTKKSALLQVGLFRQLNGAETKQSELTVLGLSPDVRKKVTVDGIMYALVLSPENEYERKLTLDILKASNINYFQAKLNDS